VTVQLVIPMSGFGERFREAGFEVPKPLIPVAGAPMIEHVLDMFPNDSQVLFIVNEGHLRKWEYHLEETLLKLRPDAKIVAVSSHKTGPSGAIALARNYINLQSKVVVNYCDFTCLWNYKDFLRKLSQCDGVVATYTGFHPHLMRSTKFAYVTGAGDQVTGIQEKQPYTSTPMMERISSGTYGFSSGSLLLDAIDKQIKRDLSLGGEFYTSLTYIPLLEEGRLIRSHNLDRFFQWGTPEDLHDFETVFRAFESIGSNPPVKKPHSTIFLAAGLGSRFSRSGYTVPKPSLSLSGRPAWTQVLRSVQGTGQTVTVCLVDAISTEEAKKWGDVVEVGVATSGQATSAQIGLNRLLDVSHPVTVASCDALFPADYRLPKGQSIPKISTWVCRPGSKARSNPEQFAWVSVNEQGQVLDFAMKQGPTGDGVWFVVSGTFTFRSGEIAKSYITEMTEEKLLTNGEFYLDNAIAIALSRGDEVKADIREDFIGIGTPEEYESFRYWQGAFHHWRRSCYNISQDWMVDTDAELDLINESLKALETPLVGVRSRD